MNAAEINRQKVMQIATESGGQPWVCSVYFVVYESNFYWLSFPTRRHSQELAENQRAAVTIPIKRDVPVVGMQCAGMVEVVNDLAEIESVLPRYVEKYGKGEKFVELYKLGKNSHVLYRFTPTEIVLFDEVNHAENPRRTYLHLSEIGA